ncbi:MAG TPA: porin [Roseateles sp.]
MKKIALAAALAATAAAPAFAQSVTLWGRINTSVESQKVGSQDRKIVVQNNSSRLGFKGSEDLGGGLKASFSLEHGLDSDTGAVSNGGVFWGRASWVQLEGSFGAVRLGNWFPDSYFSSVDRTSNHNHDTGTSSDNLFSSFGFGARTNKIGYFSPTVGGLGFIASVRAGEGTGPRGFDLSANYEVGGLHVAGTFAQNNKFNATAERKAYGLEADYGFGPFLVTGYYQREEVDGFKSRDIGRVSAMYAVGQSEFHVNVGGTRAGGDAEFKAGGAKQYTVGYNYNLSKRTKVYGFYTKTDYNGPGVNDFSSLAAGIRHNF